MTEQLVFVGRITRTHGLRGEMKVLEGLGTSGAWRQAPEVFIGPDEDAVRCYRVLQIRSSNRFAIVALEGVEDIDKAETLRDQLVFVPRGILPLPAEGSYYATDLMGMKVEDTQGRYLGELHEIFDNGAHEIYVVRKGSTEILLPVVEGVVYSLDLKEGLLVVDPPEGLDGLPEQA